MKHYCPPEMILLFPTVDDVITTSNDTSWGMLTEDEEYAQEEEY